MCARECGRRAWCSVVQCGAVWCSAVRCVAVCCSVLQCVGRECRMACQLSGQVVGGGWHLGKVSVGAIAGRGLSCFCRRGWVSFEIQSDADTGMKRRRDSGID